MQAGTRLVADVASTGSAVRQPLPPPQRQRRPPAACCPPQAADDAPCSSAQHQPASLPRRRLLVAAAATLSAAALPRSAAASKLPAAVDRAWEGLGGGPADLVFPAQFLGVWDVDSVLRRVDLPLGPELVPDMRVVQRARQEDLDTVVQYQVAFLRNARGEVVPDRAFNTASLMNTYLGMPAAEVRRRIAWNENDPNLLEMGLPGGMQVSTRVTRRSEEWQGEDRLSTSEYFQQLIASPSSPQPKVKASQCFTKYHWRPEAEAAAAAGGGVQVVATQVVSDYLTAFDDPAMMMQAGGKPVVVYTYSMAFRRPAAAAEADAAEPAGMNPAIAQREALRLFFSATTIEAQQRVLDEAASLVDLGTSLQLLCHMAEQAQRGLLPGTLHEQAALLQRLHSAIEPSLPQLSPQHLATALWAYATIGVAADWTDTLLQQAAEREMAAPAGRLTSYNTRELSSLLFAYGRLLRRRTPEVQAYGAALLQELLQRWRSLPYVKSAFSSTDFADLAEACAALFGAPDQAASSSSSGDSNSSGGSGGMTDAYVGAVAGEGAAGQLPAEVAELLDEMAYEVRRQLANKSTRSPWTPRDLVRWARAYAALGHHTPKAAQMLDSLSSFCVQRIRSRHLNCISRPADLTGLLEAYADLQHNSVVVPELLSAVDDQVRRGAAAEQEQEQQALEAAASAAAAVDPPAAPLPTDPAASVGTPPGISQPSTQAPQQQPTQPLPGRPEALSVAGVNSLLASHLRLGYAPSPLLLHSLAPQIRRQLAAGACTGPEAAGLLQLLAAVQLNPGDSLVTLLLGRVADTNAQAAEGSSGVAGSSGGGGYAALRAAAEAAAEQLLGGRST
ncbi:hypothetical protein C2E21_7942 [Chlorella sorokiniana]|uniref:DUF6816 domain-containing protein n=1 Tax=Chlorella sorokiniana TaxID=3076 RepID=A0A2P6TG83_CHLSO|nr:hypothetical protein C2E21_7942 [Chlorella sorokiniana]|eukprot:PRW33134.1 hypothetical protein C2E21_7942 [Chlorella sorokiniana]